MRSETCRPTNSHTSLRDADCLSRQATGRRSGDALPPLSVNDWKQCLGGMKLRAVAAVHRPKYARAPATAKQPALPASNSSVSAQRNLFPGERPKKTLVAPMFVRIRMSRRLPPETAARDDPKGIASDQMATMLQARASQAIAGDFRHRHLSHSVGFSRRYNVVLAAQKILTIWFNQFNGRRGGPPTPMLL